MELKLKGLRALVTGSSSGIGAGIAELLAAEGARVIVHGRDPERTQQRANTLSGGAALYVLADLSEPTGCDRLVTEVFDAVGGLDILVNNAGGKTAAGNAPWFDVAWEDWRATYEQNVGAAVRLARAFVPGMRTQGFGRIINVTSASAAQPESTVGEYAAAKAALSNLTGSMARALAHTGITVNAVMPGTILTPAVEAWLAHVAKQRGWGSDWSEIERRFTREMIPLCTDQIGRPADIARMVALLASPLSGYMTGASYRVDGGQVRTIS